MAFLFLTRSRSNLDKFHFRPKTAHEPSRNHIFTFYAQSKTRRTSGPIEKIRLEILHRMVSISFDLAIWVQFMTIFIREKSHFILLCRPTLIHPQFFCVDILSNHKLDISRSSYDDQPGQMPNELGIIEWINIWIFSVSMMPVRITNKRNPVLCKKRQ